MGLYKRGRLWWMRFSYQGRLVRDSTETTNKRLAEAIYGKIRADIIEGKYFDKRQEQSRTLKELIDRYMLERGEKLATAKGMQGYAKHLYAFFGANALLAAITTDAIAQYKTRREHDGMKPGSINRELALGRVAFNMARRQWHWCSVNPFSDAGSCPGEVARDRYLSNAEEARLLSECPEWLQELLVFKLHTGLRFSELVQFPGRQ